MQHTRGKKHRWRPDAWRTESAQPVSGPSGLPSALMRGGAMGPRVVLHLGSAAQAPPAGQMSYGAYQVFALPWTEWCSSLSGTVPPEDHWATNGELITTSQFHPCRRRGSSLLKLIGTHSRRGFRFPACSTLSGTTLRAHRKQNWLTQGISENHARPRDPLTAHQGLRGQVAMGSKVAISAPTIQKLLVFWNSGMASTKHTWGAHWDLRARGAGVSPSRDRTCSISAILSSPRGKMYGPWIRG